MSATQQLNQRLQAERAAIENLYRAFSDKNPDGVISR